MPRYYDPVDMVNEHGEVTISIRADHGNVLLGGGGQDGDLSLRDRAGQLTIHLNGHHGAVTLGGNAQDGDLTLRNAANVQTMHLNGQQATLHLGATGQDGDVFLYNASGDNTLKLDGRTGGITVNGTRLNVPDYVLANDYCLPSLSETKSFAAKQGHLPGVPSESEIRCSGLDLSHFSMVLLEKIEELTLHAIQQEERILALEARHSNAER